MALDPPPHPLPTCTYGRCCSPGGRPAPTRPLVPAPARPDPPIAHPASQLPTAHAANLCPLLSACAPPTPPPPAPPAAQLPPIPQPLAFPAGCCPLAWAQVPLPRQRRLAPGPSPVVASPCTSLLMRPIRTRHGPRSVQPHVFLLFFSFLCLVHLHFLVSIPQLVCVLHLLSLRLCFIACLPLSTASPLLQLMYPPVAVTSRSM